MEAEVRAALSVGAQDYLTCDLVSGLTRLDAEQAGIAHLVGIQNLTSLTQLDLSHNTITDISALSGLTSLERLRLDGNPRVTDLRPLLGNAGLGAGDRVDLRFTGVYCANVAAMEAKGVRVESDCS